MFAFPRGVLYGREFPAAITVYVDGVLQRRAACYYQVTVYDHVLVAMTDIRMDEAITPANAHVEESAVDTLPETTVTDFDRLAGRVAGRYIRKGTVITPTLLAMPRVLTAGSPVTLVAERRPDGGQPRDARRGEWRHHDPRRGRSTGGRTHRLCDPRAQRTIGEDHARACDRREDGSDYCMICSRIERVP